jgi:hypothetical protein
MKKTLSVRVSSCDKFIQKNLQPASSCLARSVTWELAIKWKYAVGMRVD